MERMDLVIMKRFVMEAKVRFIVEADSIEEAEELACDNLMFSLNECESAEVECIEECED